MPTRGALSWPLTTGKHRLRSAGALGARSVGLAGIVLAGLVLLVSLGAVRYERQERLQDAIVFTELMTRVLEDHATRSVDTATMALAALAELVGQSELQADTQLGWVLAQSLASQPVLREVAVIDERGLVLASTAPGNQNSVIDLARLGALPPPGAEALGAFVRGRDLGALTSDAAAAAVPPGVGFVPLVRQVATPGPRTLLLVGLINPDALANHQQQMLGDHGSSAALASYSGQVLAAHAGVPVTPGDSVAALPVFSRYLPGIEHGSFVGRGMGDGDQILAFRASRTRPMVVMVETPVAVALASWHRDARAVGWAAALVALVIVLLSQLAARSLSSRETARRQRDEAQGAVAARERELSVIVTSVQELLFRTDAQGRLTFVNARWQAASGHTEAAALGQSLDSLVRPASEAAARRLFVHEGQDGLRTAELLMGSDASERRFDVAVAPLYAQGGIVGFAGSAVDVTAQRLVQGHLRAQLALTELLLDVLPVPMSILDCQGCYTSVNQAWQEFTGQQRQDVVGRPARSFRTPEEAEEHDRRDVELMARGGRIRYEARIAHQDGSVRDLAITKAAVPGPDGPITGILAAFMDVTEFREAERATRSARARAEQASAFKSEFLANMSHEIRTPMNAILGMLKVLQTTGLQPRQLDYVNKTEGAAKSLLGLLNDILDFSKVEAGKMTLDAQPFTLDRLLRDLSVIFSASVGNKPVEVLFDIDPRVPRELVGDSLRLQQILINLGGNAIKFTSKGEVVLRVRLEAMEGDGLEQQARLHFAVQDSGIGIAPENQQKIFTSFSQAEASTTRRFGGTGLGLSISRRFIELMGGELQLQSTLGQGSTFSFTVQLPVVDAKPVPGNLALPHATGLPVLAVDDNPVARELMLTMGQSLGWTVETADGGEAALALIDERARRGEPYQAVFMDWLMPGMDGWQTSARIRSRAVDGQAATDSTIIMMFTAHGHEMLAQQTDAVQNLIDGYLVKPVTALMLLGAMQDAMSPNRTVESAQGKRTSSEVMRPLAGIRLLLVEDNAINQEVAEALLSGQGAAVDITENGLRGVEAVQTAITAGKLYHAVLMDMQMPVMDGLMATREIRRLVSAEALPIIAMTANAMASDREVCLEAGMNDHVGKPFDLDNLVATLLHWIEGERHAAAAHRKRAQDPKTASAPFPAVAGIEVEVAAALLNNDVDLFVMLLGLIADEFGDLSHMRTAADVAPWLATPDTRQQLSARIHKLRGSAGTVGARKVLDSATAAERALSDRTDDEVQRVLELNVLLGQMVEGIQDMLAAQKASDTPASAAGAAAPIDLAALARLTSLLRAQDFAALDLYTELETSLSAALCAGAAGELSSAMQGLDFPRALTLLQKLVLP